MATQGAWLAESVESDKASTSVDGGSWLAQAMPKNAEAGGYLTVAVIFSHQRVRIESYARPQQVVTEVGDGVA